MKDTSIPRRYVLDENNKKVAVMLDVKTFDKIEEALENYGLMQFIKENKKEKPLKAAEAKSYYSNLSKGK
jgi:hypothetical protein